MSRANPDSVPVPKLAEDLRVRTLVRGSVRQGRGRVRIVAELIEATSGETLWADTYDRPAEDLFDVQSDIATRVAEALAAELEPDEMRLMTGSPAALPTSFTEMKLGNPDRADVLLEEALEYDRSILEREELPALYDLARVHALRGELREAKGRLRQAVDAGWPWPYPHMGPGDPLLDALRGDPEFRGMMQEIRNDLDLQRAAVGAIDGPPDNRESGSMIEQARHDIDHVRRGGHLRATETGRR